MPLHPDAAAVLELLDQLGVPPFEALDPETARELFAQLAREPEERCHEWRDVDAGGVPARLYLPAPGDTAPGVLVWFHGGGWVIGSVEAVDATCHALVNATGHAVLSVDYRLAPEAPFPAALDDCLAATRWVHAHAAELGVDADRIAVGGDSAGGNLAAVVAQLGPVPLRFQLLVYPVTDARAGSASYEENGVGYLLTAAAMHWFIEHYLSGGAGSRSDPRVSPLLGADEAVAATPPALVITAGFDPLRDEGMQYVDRLLAAGVTASALHFPGQIHGFFGMTDTVADARHAQAAAAQALRDALG